MTKLILILLIALPSWVFANNDSFTLINNNQTFQVTTAELESFPSNDIKTSTNFTPACNFSGALVSDFVRKYNIDPNSKFKIFALDDYSYTVPVNELIKYHALLAYKKDNKYMDIASLGPFATIFPKDDVPELQNLDIDAKTVWMIKSIEVEK
ncbi:oxidoreductase [Erwinia psidii]|uniref:oxidoreductase n=1 Tax=Erwinia psidii TaxID=69224 RepID=UPI00226B7AB8|nr:oxidoreductase [Erwinia psidii]MCX8967029.1 oxidoreductase [Erwinia psidii]